MQKMTKKEKFKKFVYDHRETIARVTVYTTLIAGSIAIIINAASNEKEAADKTEAYNSWAEGENEWLEEKQSEGMKTFLLADWTYLLVPEDAETEWIYDRNKNPKH